ncbi:MAG: hypothetical protein ACXVAS_19050, partial [Vulcanimicrobiaceae bacterium]
IVHMMNRRVRNPGFQQLGVEQLDRGPIQSIYAFIEGLLGAAPPAHRISKRIAALEHHFEQSLSTFALFSSDPRTAKLLELPKNESEQFLR